MMFLIAVLQHTNEYFTNLTSGSFTVEGKRKKGVTIKSCLLLTTLNINF